jgi:uncharacterized protein
MMPMTTNNKIPNRLINEKSPYLLQHAYNPVDWYPWGEEAFAKAKQEDKPIFLSIGYSTCHWCHVMERESFEDEEVAEVLNKNFISIKVDREERPDIDHIYMEVCQSMTGHGGWPMTIIMTPEQKPFFAGTYFPKNNYRGMEGLMGLLDKVKNAWENNRNGILEYGDELVEAMNEVQKNRVVELDEQVMDKAYSQFQAQFDKVYGGFGSSPKFPKPHNLYFLLKYWKKTKEDLALQMVEKTLDSMYIGGIYDHIGFGFSRYSTDRKWLVPHFEKMLYDNALLTVAYLETYEVTKNKRYADIAEQILTYILRDMTSPEGAFYCAEDADSEGVEGKFYVWSVEEVNEVLGEEDGKRFSAHFDITMEGNFEGKCIPNLIKTSSEKEDEQFISNCREKLFKHRDKRVHPYKDDKILTSWNGLMIAAMAMGGRVLDKKEYTEAAEKAVGFIYNKLVREDGRLLARYREGEAAFSAYVDDYAFLTWGLIELYKATSNSKHIDKAVGLTEDLLEYFWDEKNGGLYIYGSDAEKLIIRPKDIYDGATPSGNSVSVVNLLRIGEITNNNVFKDKAEEILKAFSINIKDVPMAHTFSLIGLMLTFS